MIDFDRFWAVPGDWTEDDAYGQETPQPGVTSEQIGSWETTRGVSLPGALREALSRQNGGTLRDSNVQIRPLEEILPASSELWEYASYAEHEIRDRALVFELGEDQDLGGQYFLNFNAKGRRGEPSVYEYHSDPGDLDKVSSSLTKFFERILATSESPAIDWSEVDKPDARVLARETIDISPTHGPGSTNEQVLVRHASALWLYTHLSSKNEESLTRLSLPLPLDSDWALIRKLRPAPISTHALHLQPAESAAIVQTESTRTKDGRWKNSSMRGAPIYGYFESVDPDTLKALRTELLGGESAKKAQRIEDAQEQLSQSLDTVAPEARQAAMLNVALQMREQMNQRFREQFGFDFAVPPSPEMAKLAELVQGRLAQVIDQTQGKIAQNPPDPETVQRLEDLFKKTIPGHGSTDES
jgi:hypothetical protein